MNKRVVEHEIKLEKSVKVILGVLALGVLLNAFAPVLDVKEAFARGEQKVRVTNFPTIQMVDCFGGCR